MKKPKYKIGDLVVYGTEWVCKQAVITHAFYHEDPNGEWAYCLEGLCTYDSYLERDILYKL